MANEMVFIRNIFMRSGIGEIDDDEPSIYRKNFAIEASNRFFTESNLVTNETYLPYPPKEDPFGCVNACAVKLQDKLPLVRVSENDVLFFKKVIHMDKEGKT